MILSLKDNDISCVLKERDGRRFMVFEAKNEPSVLMVDEAVESLLFNQRRGIIIAEGRGKKNETSHHFK